MDFIRQIVRPRMWCSRNDEILDRDARGESTLEIAAAVRISPARVRRVLQLEVEVEG